MQINLQSPYLKEFFKYLGWILLFVFLWLRGCSGSTPTPQIVKVTVPEVKGSFQAKKPVHEAVTKPSSRRQEKGVTEYIDNPIDEKLITENEKLKSDFAKETDSLKRIIAYNKSMQLNKFSSTPFEDENIIINIEGIVQGEVKEITPSYVRKKIETQVQVKQKQTVLRVLVGGSIGVNKELNQAAYQLDLNFQNRKGDILSAEYLNVGGQQFGMVGFKKSIFNIKK
ncbi:hypothetical protein [Flavobacterium sp. GNP002]